jgi:hypothetical protein
VKANATDLPPPTPVSVSASAEAVTALYRTHALGNTFTPLPARGNSTADQSGAW